MGIWLVNLYKDYNNLRMDPLGISNELSSETGKYEFLLIGDSIIRNWIINGYLTLNKGIASQTSTQVLYRVKFLNKNVYAKNAIICVGGNDLKSLRVFPDNSRQIVDKVITNIQNIIDTIDNNCDNIYIMTIPPISSVPFYLKPLKSTKAILNSLNAINNTIKSGLNRNVRVIDVEKVINGIPAKHVYADDNVHLSQKVYEEILKEIM